MPPSSLRSALQPLITLSGPSTLISYMSRAACTSNDSTDLSATSTPGIGIGVVCVWGGGVVLERLPCEW